MSRTTLAIGAVLLASAGPACGQGFTNPLPTPPPVRVPGTNQLVPWPGPPPRFRPIPWIGVPWFGGYSYYSTSSNYPPVGYFGWDVSPPPVRVANDAPAIVPELPAEWTIEFPAPADVTLNGALVEGSGPVRRLSSPPLKPGASYTFAVTARWVLDGKQYEWDRTLRLGAGERSRSTVLRGFPVAK